MTCAQGDGTRQLHDGFQNVVSKWMKQADIRHNGGAHGLKHTCKGTFDQQVNNLQNLDDTSSRCLNGIIPDISNTTGKNIEGSPNTLFGDTQTLCDVKSLAPGQAYSKYQPRRTRQMRSRNGIPKSPRTTTKRPRSWTRNSGPPPAQLGQSKLR